MSTVLRSQSGFLDLADEQSGFAERRMLDGAAVGALRSLSDRYRVLRGRDDPASLLALGRDLHGWLDGAEGWLARLRSTLVPPFILELRASRQPDEVDGVLLQAPWELLADDQGFLAADVLLAYAPVRRLGELQPPPRLDAYRLGLVFMAAAPRGEHELDFEAEETAILGAAGGLGVDLEVEESGNAEELAARLTALGGLPALHLCCHGHDAWTPSPGQPPRPVLLLEDVEGGPALTDAPALVQSLGSHRPRFLFLSACLTASADGQGTRAGVAHSLATALVAAGLPAVLGWDGSVRDGPAIDFARRLYLELARRRPLEEAVSAARQELLTAKEPAGDWHLARLWLGRAGGGPIVGGVKKRSLLPAHHGHGHKEFLASGRRSPVASREMFVGRRRELQTALRLLRNGARAGLLIHGMGRLGKSSLAARIANRRTDLALAVLYEHYDPESVLIELREALKDKRAARELLDRGIEAIRRDPSQLEEVLLDLLSGPCAQDSEQGRPVLLIVDDLERLLEPQTGTSGYRVKPAHVAVLRAVLRAFDPVLSESRLVLTSRFTFTLPDGDGREDLAGRLHDVHLPPLHPAGRAKLELRQLEAVDGRLALDRLDDVQLTARRPLLDRARAASGGSPGLQDLLGQLVLSPRMPVNDADTAVGQVEAYLQRGDLPVQAEAQAFLQDLGLEQLLGLAGEASRAFLRATTLFELPVPVEILDNLAGAIGGSPAALLGLGLLDGYSDPVEPRRPAAAVNALVRPKLLPSLTKAEREELARTVLPDLFRLWGGEDSERRPNAANIALTRLAVAATDTSVLEACAAPAVWALTVTARYAAAADLGRRAVGALDRGAIAPPLNLLRHASHACLLVGETAAGDELLVRGDVLVETAAASGRAYDTRDEDAFNQARAHRLLELGRLDEAALLSERVRERSAAFGDELLATLAISTVARVKAQRGDLTAALLLRREQLAVYERLGHDLNRAVILGEIAEIEDRLGGLGEALRLHHEELGVYERIGAVRERAVTLCQIAEIELKQGDFEKARNHNTEALHVFERLGDVRERAHAVLVSGDIETKRGDPEEARRLYGEVLSAAEGRADERGRAAALSRIAGLEVERGNFEAAYCMYRRMHDACRRSGDAHGRVVALGRLADVESKRGRHRRALRLNRHYFALAESVGDELELTIAQTRVAQAEAERGNLDEAMRRYAEAIPTFERFGRTRESVHVFRKMAEIEVDRDNLDEAMQFCRRGLAHSGAGDESDMSEIFWVLAEVEFRRDNLRGAIHFARERLAVVDKIGKPAARAGVLSTIAQIGAMLGYLTEATTAINEAFDIYDRLGWSVQRPAADPRNRPEGLWMTGIELGQALADRGEIDAALAVLRRAAHGARCLGQTIAAAQIRRMIRRLPRAARGGS